MDRIFTNNIVDIRTLGGYTYSQVINNKNVSKDSKYWYLLEHTKDLSEPRYIFKSKVAESWEWFDPNIENPIRNTNQIYLKFKNVSKFVEPSNYYRENGEYPYIKTPDTIEYNKYWDDLEEKILNGFEVDGVRITGRHFFMINFGRFKAIPVDVYGRATSTRKIWTFLKFIDHQYYIMHELEECFLEGTFGNLDKYLEWFPGKGQYDFELLKLQNFPTSKARRKGWSAAIGIGGFSYNFTFLESSMNIIAAYEKGKYKPILDAVHDTKSFLDINTPWKRRTDIKGTRDHFIAGVEVSDEYGVKSKIGYKSEVLALSFKDNPFKAVGSSADLIDIEEAGIFHRLIETYQVSMEPLIRDGETMIGTCIVGGTAGDLESGASEGLAEIMNNPDEYGFKSYLNIYEKQDLNTNSGWFIDDLWYSPLKIKKEDILKMDFSERTINLLDKFDGEYIETVDIYGNSYRYFSNIILENKRDSKRKISSLAYQKFITQQPKYLSEAFLLNEASPFDTATAKEVLGELMIKKPDYKKGVFSLVQGKPKFRLNMELVEIDTYNFKGYDTTGCWVIYEEPITINGEIPTWRFIAGCLTPGEKVLTDKGLISVEEVKLTDLLVNEVGKLVPIIDKLVYDKVDEDIYTINMCNTFRTTTFTKEHPILVSKPNQKINWKKYHPKYKYNQPYYDFNFEYKEVSCIEKGDWVKLPNIYLEESNIDLNNFWNNDSYRIDRQIKSPLYNKDFWWFIGLWLGDGWCEYDNYKISVAFNRNEIKYINKLEKVVNALFHRKVHKRERGNNGIQCSFSFQQLSFFLKENFGKYAEYKYIPEWTKKISKNLKLNLILGYLDSDGSIMKLGKYHSTEFVSINLELLESVQDILFSLGVVSGLTKLRNAGKRTINNRLVNTKETYHLRIAHRDSILLYEKLIQIDKQNIKLNRISNTSKGRKTRPQCFLSDDLKYIYLKINNINKSKYTGRVYNFHCETNTFMCHHITTHNCDPVDYGTEESSSEGSHSMAATYIIDTITRNIVAEYIGRPAKADDYFEQLWRGLEYYNAFLLYENNLKSLFSYFKLKNKLHLLAPEPESLKGRSGYRPNNRVYGFHATSASNSYARELIHTWTLEDIVINQTEDGQNIYVPRMYYIRSKGLLQELILWNSKGNFDRISSLGAAMILLFDRTYEEDDIQNTSSIMEEGIFLKLRSMINKQNKFNFR